MMRCVVFKGMLGLDNLWVQKHQNQQDYLRRKVGEPKGSWGKSQ